MLMKYYEVYKEYCNKYHVKKLSIDKFILNARRRKIKLIQICCPYCGEIRIDIRTESFSKIKKQLQYCSKCGKKSTSINIFFQLSSLIRMQGVHRAGYSTFSSKYNRVNDTGEETFGLLCFAEITEFAKELHSEMEKVVLMDELPENWTYPLIQPKLIEKYLQVKIIL